MPKVRTPWGRRAMHTMIDKSIDTVDVAKGTEMTRQYVASILYGRVDSPNARKKISDFLGISDSEDDED